MIRLLFGLALALGSMAAIAGPPTASVTVVNTPLPVTALPQYTSPDDFRGYWFEWSQVGDRSSSLRLGGARDLVLVGVSLDFDIISPLDDPFVECQVATALNDRFHTLASIRLVGGTPHKSIYVPLPNIFIASGSEELLIYGSNSDSRVNCDGIVTLFWIEQ